MNKNNSAPEYLGRKDSDRYFQIPQWGIKSDIYLALTKNELKLFLFFIGKTDKYTRATPAYTITDLAERCRINRKYIRPSILTLAAHKFIRPINNGIRVKVFVIFDPPHDLFIQKHRMALNTPLQEDTSLNSSTLKAKVLNRRTPSETGGKLSHALGHFVSDSGTFGNTLGDKMGHASAWVTAHEPFERSEDYEPGADTEELNSICQ